MPGTNSFGVAAGLLVGQAKILAGIAAGLPLNRTLEALAELVQESTAGALVSILLLDESGLRLHIGAAPSLPAEYNDAIEGVQIGADVGSCGTAAYTGKLVVAEDIESDPHWIPWRGVALKHGLRACWSSPIFSRHRQVLGTFAMYYREAGSPTAADLETIGIAAHLAAVAIEQTRSEDARQRSEGKFQVIFDQAFSAMLIIDNEQSILDANPAASLLFGVPHEDLLGRHINVFSEPVLTRDLPDWNAAWTRFLAEGEFSGERIVRNASGEERRAFHHTRANFQPGQHLCVMLDVTQLRRTEQVVAQTEHLYRTLVEATNTGYCVIDPNVGVIDANAEYLRLTGFGRLEEIRGRNIREWTAPYDWDRHAAEIARCVDEGTARNVEIDYIDRAGKITPVEINARSIQTEGGTLLLAMVRDIGDRQRARQELQLAHEELESRVQQRTAELARANAQIRQRALQQEAVAAFGRQAVMGSTLDTLLQEAAEQVSNTLDLSIGCVMEHGRNGREEFILRACAGWRDAPIGLTVSYAGKNTQAGRVMRTREAVIIEDLSADPQFVPLFDDVPFGLQSSMYVVISGEDEPFGVLGAHSTQRRKFTHDDIHFLQSMANVLAAAIERKHGEQALQLAQQTAVRANNAKSEFLSRMSHELRTPLNAILGFGQLLEIEQLSTGQHESVDQIVRAGRHLLTLVNEVLDISRIEAGQLALAPEAIAAGDLLRETVDLIRPLANARAISVTVEPDPASGGHYILADRQRFRQVLLNLLSNAVKYNREGGSVNIRVGMSKEGERVRVEIRDTGVGIAQAKLSRLFMPFERLGAENTTVEGNGMGLALSKRLVDSQRGIIGAESVENVGSLFWVEMPVAAAPGDDTSLTSDVLEELFARSPVLLEEPEDSYQGKQAETSPVVEKQVVLHIEDNESNRRLIEMLLAQRPSLQLMSAARGEQGLELAREHHPALILLDMHLPDTTGEDVLSHLRAEEATKETPVVVVSADATAARSHKLRAAGANDYLTKPFNVVQFLKILDDYLFQGKAPGKK